MSYYEMGQIAPFNVPSSMELLSDPGEGSLGQVTPFDVPSSMELLSDPGYGTLGAFGGGGTTRAFPVRSDWCSPSNPQPSCKPLRSSGVEVCKPMTAVALDVFKGIQHELNRAAHVKGWRRIKIDGRIGPETITLFNKVASAADLDQAATCNDIAANADQLLADLSLYAEMDLKAPERVASAPGAQPSKPAAGGKVKHPPGTSGEKGEGVVGFITSPLGLAALAVSGLLIWKVADRTKKKRRRAA